MLSPPAPQAGQRFLDSDRYSGSRICSSACLGQHLPKKENNKKKDCTQESRTGSPRSSLHCWVPSGQGIQYPHTCQGSEGDRTLLRGPHSARLLPTPSTCHARILLRTRSRRASCPLPHALPTTEGRALHRSHLPGLGVPLHPTPLILLCQLLPWPGRNPLPPWSLAHLLLDLHNNSRQRATTGLLPLATRKHAWGKRRTPSAAGGPGPRRERGEKAGASRER